MRNIPQIKAGINDEEISTTTLSVAKTTVVCNSEE
jgi:hypothetical protein